MNILKFAVIFHIFFPQIIERRKIDSRARQVWVQILGLPNISHVTLPSSTLWPSVPSSVDWRWSCYLTGGGEHWLDSQHSARRSEAAPSTDQLLFHKCQVSMTHHMAWTLRLALSGYRGVICLKQMETSNFKLSELAGTHSFYRSWCSLRSEAMEE